ncbi:ROK family protein [Variovorax dokdonensis]|uniref:ROK family protein n=1 Tax=Variovorax dokdonensis TaxID=344883 RepID=A0ABT7NEM6_9BURK|nr:ROK family protein [Variovorax dokdonensis]MDM0046388.1 ROK family protein [Variovorax dokdonensis]
MSKHSATASSESEALAAPLRHGTMELPSVCVEGYSLAIRGAKGFIGDAASQTAFRKLLQTWRKRQRKRYLRDPLAGNGGAKNGEHVSKRVLDEVLSAPVASAASDMLDAAIEDFAEDLADVILQYRQHDSWKKVQRIVIGGGFPGSAVGEHALLQAAAVLHHQDCPVELARLCHDVDDAGLLGWVHLTPPALIERHEAILAVDIGGTNVRCGIVETRRNKASDLSRARVIRRSKWRHADDKPARSELLDGIAQMLHELAAHARRKKIDLAPFVGVACPGRVLRDGAISRGAHNMPGDWSRDKFHLPRALGELLPDIGGERPQVLLHNDAVIQGLSELPFMQDVRHWAVLTIGTGLGNATYVNREPVRAPS